MAWYDEAVFYHIYPLGLCGAPKQNTYGATEHRLNTLIPWISHISKIGCTALYIGPLFESVGHGYETTDYKKLDSRLGTNEDLKAFVKECHSQGIRVIFDGVFNHTGRDFFAFRDIQKNREHSPYLNWYCNVNFGGNNEYNDGFSYDNWGGFNLLVKLNQRNPEVVGYICDVVRFWVSEFDVDGIRLDAADVLDFDFMKSLRTVANEVKPDFWLMGEVIHGDYTRWVNEGTLHSVTNYHLHKALYSGHNDHNYFEIAHTVRRQIDSGMSSGSIRLYNFVDNHDVERIYTKLQNKAHYAPVHILLYTLPGIPSVYYGSEFGIEGKKERYSDDSLRPALNLADFDGALQNNPCTALITALGKAKRDIPALTYGSYEERHLTNRQYAFARTLQGQDVIVMVNNDDREATIRVRANAGAYTGVLSGRMINASDHMLGATIQANFGEIWVSAGEECVTTPKVISESAVRKAEAANTTSVVSGDAETDFTGKSESVGEKILAEREAKAQKETSAQVIVPADKPYEDMTVEELQAAILAKMANNGPVTDQMRRSVEENIWHNSLVNWVKSFR